MNKSCRRHVGGFTLVELLIVVLILAIVGAVAIPKFGSSTKDAKLSTLESNLSIMRNAIERYYHDHGAVYPGSKKASDGSDVGTTVRCASAFRAQLTRYSQSNGVTAKEKSATAKYGPYVRGVKLPENPFTSTRSVSCDITEGDITLAASDGTTAWKFYLKTGRFIANDGAHDSY